MKNERVWKWRKKRKSDMKKWEREMRKSDGEVWEWFDEKSFEKWNESKKNWIG